MFTFKQGVLFGENFSSEDEILSVQEQFAKILNTFNILVIGYTISHLIPIALTKREKSILEKDDFDAWFEMRGFSDDDEGLFINCTSGIHQKQFQKTLMKKSFMNC